MATRKQHPAIKSVSSTNHETTEIAKAPRKSRAKKVEEAPVETGVLEHIEEMVTDKVTEVKEVKRRKPSARERGADGKVLRKGRNLSGNQPFQGKNYYYDLEVAEGEEYDKAFQAAPMQVRLILKYMAEEGITTPDDAVRGGEIAGGAIKQGYLQSKIDPPALFAYYRRVMERLGLTLASEG